ncbi:unnamed protein product [Calicophoron daubneyi]|uniref:Bcl-2 Bcl-2 homology region 1-3 domain-containing protein n=1 Tax=Calicophoron daubneyi TaxID=300641 RepID=A0AAV2SWJ7_CALDB
MSKSGPLRSASPYDTERSSAGNTTESSSVDVPDGLQRPGSVLSPFECGAVKRFKPDDHETDSGHRDFQLSKTCSEPTPTLSHLNDRRTSVQSDVSSAHTLARLAKCVCRLADHFETRYHDRLGSLLDDVAHLSTSCKDESVATEADGSPSKQSPASDSTQSAVSSDVANENQSRIVACPEDVELLSARNRFHTVLTELFSERINWGRIIAMLAFVRALCEWVERTRLSRKSRSTATGSLVTQQDTVSETEAEAPTDTSLVRHRSTSGSPGIQSPNAGDHEQLTSSESEAVAPSVTSCSQQSTSNGDEFHAQRLRAAHYVAWTAEFIHGSHGIWDWIAANGGWEGLFEFEADKGIYTSHEDEPVVIGLTEDDAMRILRRAVTGVATLVVGAAGLVAALRFFSRRL